ncbi:MAG: GcrA family cell cycle regulator [Beijerinckiaceae bacterium]|nr:GcrA family cell cycle regulator [Beijerinckiaceae bacterium]
MSWTDERVELLKKLWLDGHSASRIAAELAAGVTRNAVIGKVHRLGLSGREKAAMPVSPARARPKTAPQSPVRAPAPQPRAAAMPMRGNTALAMHHAAPVPLPQALRATTDVVVPMCEHVTIMELRESMCRWPMGDPTSADFRYCGGKTPAGEGPYCNIHSRMAYQPTQDRRRERRIA